MKRLPCIIMMVYFGLMAIAAGKVDDYDMPILSSNDNISHYESSNSSITTDTLTNNINVTYYYNSKYNEVPLKPFSVRHVKFSPRPTSIHDSLYISLDSALHLLSQTSYPELFVMRILNYEGHEYFAIDDDLYSLVSERAKRFYGGFYYNGRPIFVEYANDSMSSKIINELFCDQGDSISVIFNPIPIDNYYYKVYDFSSSVQGLIDDGKFIPLIVMIDYKYLYNYLDSIN